MYKSCQENETFAGNKICLTSDITFYLSDTETLLPFESSNGETVSFPYPCTQMASTIINNEEVILGLTERFRFYVNDVEVGHVLIFLYKSLYLHHHHLHIHMFICTGRD